MGSGCDHSRFTSPRGPGQAVPCGGAGRDQAGVPGPWKFLELTPLLREKSPPPSDRRPDLFWWLEGDAAVLGTA